MFLAYLIQFVNSGLFPHFQTGSTEQFSCWICWTITAYANIDIYSQLLETNERTIFNYENQ